MNQPYEPGHGGNPQQPWGSGQQGYPGRQPPQPPPQQAQPGGYPGGHPQQPGPPPQQGYGPQQGQYQQGQYQQGQYQQGQYPPNQQPAHQVAQHGYGAPGWNAGPAHAGRGQGSPLGIATAIAGALMAIGAFLPWVSVKLNLGTSNIFGGAISTHSYSKSVSGIKSWEGKVVLLCALAAIGLGIAAMVANARLGIFAAIPGVLALLVLLKVLINKASYDSKVPSLPGSQSSINVSLSAGFWIALVMAVAVIGAGVVTGVAARSR